MSYKKEIQNLSRRHFFKSSTAMASALAFVSTSCTLTGHLFGEPLSSDDLQIQNSEFGALSIMQGLTTENWTYLQILHPSQNKYFFEVYEENNILNTPKPVQVIKEYKPSGSLWTLTLIKVSFLEINKNYFLKVRESGVRVVDTRIFTALNTKLKNPKLAVMSCMNDSFEEERTTMWQSVELSKPDHLFFIGDTCYADNGSDGTIQGIYKRYLETRLSLNIFRQKKLVPILAVWDDHDFGDNNADSSFGLKKQTLELFSHFWLYPEEENFYQRGPGVSQFLKIFNQKIALMDSRFYRDSRSQWGDEQEKILFDFLQKSTEPIWIMNGSQFFGAYLKKDAFEYIQGPKLKEICEKLKTISAPLVLLSGDVHFSEIMKIEKSIFGYDTFEITSSSIHSPTFPGNHLRRKNPRREVATSAHNFNLIQIQSSSPKTLNLYVQCLGAGARKYYDRVLNIKWGF